MPAGPFTMGSDHRGQEDEHPAHTVTLARLLARQDRGHQRSLRALRRPPGLPSSRSQELAAQPFRRRPSVPLARATHQQHRLGRCQGVLRLARQAASYRSRVGKSCARHRRSPVPLGRRSTRLGARRVRQPHEPPSRLQAERRGAVRAPRYGGQRVGMARGHLRSLRLPPSRSRSRGTGLVRRSARGSKRASTKGNARASPDRTPSPPNASTCCAAARSTTTGPGCDHRTACTTRGIFTSS